VPELPEVETIARELKPLVVGSTITSFWTDWPRAVKHPTPERLAAEVAGLTVYDVSRRAKWLVLALGDDAALAIQVKMTGQLFVLPAEAPRDPHVHVVFGLDGERELRLRDVRKFARVGLYRRNETGGVLAADDAAELFQEFGPEPLDADFTLRRFRERIRGRRARLKPLLVDQAFLAGVGNIYADEALWRARLHPLRSAAATRVVGRRLHRPGGTWRDAGAPGRLPADGRALSPLLSSGQAHRPRHPLDALLFVVPAAAQRRADPRQPEAARGRTRHQGPAGNAVERVADRRGRGRHVG
jgi:formamidopyrimidine-DNA glycosylase